MSSSSSSPPSSPSPLSTSEFIRRRSASMAWEASPSATVERKRLELDGPKEAGRVTSVVRYLANSDFNEHPHPDGEEILVVDGVFSDDSGDFPRGTYILNPEGYSHAPRSKDGCVLFVKLRQYPGLNRRQIRINSYDPETWQSAPDPSLSAQGNVRQCPLYRPLPGDTSQETMDLLELEEGASLTIPVQPAGLELFVLPGAATTTGSSNPVLTASGLDPFLEGDWLKMLETKTPLSLRAMTRVKLYVKANHLGSVAPSG
ncbi:Hypothetical Protein FCC1311_020632 [Hondaea fermentalgiana]|uniref:ChrR-like cupin domain-containing protein n=1 Tax=Hondaea fermentalgiana TaxID=2315210 RepID=A0A2R5GDF9_9STRA|nr:Hypothetical Protein FCC1311_020632 [Hondaea fermentalgiana]|eukprot:GBG25844.1 Hypothetical Protein FCC1311_020632 [Hondaea fermentalgiana]